ncbi:MAG TPA: YkvA family protein [Polyangiaceae bacterium]|nr:YkvA family protein [Polyangiaceae bacterium]
MNEEESRLLTACAQFLGSLPADTASLAEALRDESLASDKRRPLAAALNYLFKSLDLIDDGIEGLGFLDDAFVLRIAAEQAGSGVSEAVDALGQSAELVNELLGAEISSRLGKYVHGLRELAVRGRSVEAILSDSAVRDELLADIAGWAARYERPAFAADPKDLVTLRAFLAAKLPS